MIVDLALPRLSNRRERSLRLRFGLEDRRIHTYREIASELKLTTYPTSYQYKRSLHSLFQSNHVWLERLHAWLNPARGDLSQADDRARAEWATELQADPEIIPAWVELERNYRKVYDLWRPGWLVPPIPRFDAKTGRWTMVVPGIASIDLPGRELHAESPRGLITMVKQHLMPVLEERARQRAEWVAQAKQSLEDDDDDDD